MDVYRVLLIVIGISSLSLVLYFTPLSKLHLQNRYIFFSAEEKQNERYSENLWPTGEPTTRISDLKKEVPTSHSVELVTSTPDVMVNKTQHTQNMDGAPNKTTSEGNSYTPKNATNLSQSTGTMVTAYFQINSKHPPEKYERWMKSMLTLPDAMVVFTTRDMFKTIQEHRKHWLDKTFIIEMSLTDTKMAKDYNETFWQHQLMMDPEKAKHKSYELFWVWNEKSNFLKKAIELNPFNSTYFMWSDIGCYRFDRPFGNLQMTNMGLLDRFPDKILMVNIHPYKMPLSSEKDPFFSSCGGGIKCRRVAGAQFACRAHACLLWREIYYKTLKLYVEDGKFIGEDQNLMAGTCLRNPSMCLFFRPRRGNHWFGLQPVLRGEYEPEVFTLEDFAISPEKFDLDEARMSVLSNLTVSNLSDILNSSVHHDWDHLQRADGTMVTAYFPIKSKHKFSEYNSWMRRMLTLPDAMVIFTSPDRVEQIKSHRIHAVNMTLIIQMTLEETSMAQKYSIDFWEKQFLLDPEKGRHKNYKLFWIWVEKTNWVKQAIDINPFNSKFFMWSDIGCYRFARPNGKLQMKDLSLLSQNPDRILMVNIHPYKTPLSSERDPFFSSCGGGIKCRRISGSQFAGTKEAFLRWHRIFYSTFEYYIKEGKFAGEDQNLMAGTCLRTPSVCLLFRSEQGNKYFGLQPVLRGKYLPKVFTLDNPGIVPRSNVTENTTVS